MNRANLVYNIKNQLADSDGDYAGRIYEREVDISAAEILLLNSAPKELVPAPGALKVIEFLSMVAYLTVGTVAYANGGALTVRTLAGNADVSEDIAAADLINHATSVCRAANSDLCAGGADVDLAINDGLELYVAGAEHINGGGGTLKVKIMYRIHDFN